MKKNKLLALIFTFLLIAQTNFIAVFADETQPNKDVITKRKINNDDNEKQLDTITKTTPKKQRKTLSVGEWDTLSTTNVPGVYFQKMDSYGRLTKKYFFYNQITKKMVEIPNKTSISSTKDLGNLENEYKMYSNKSDIFTHNGRTYIIPSITPNVTRELNIGSWKYLKTTGISGIYQMECFCGKCEPPTEYFFYNTKTRKMICVKTTKPITSTKDFGELEEEFELYGNKSNTFIHNGEKYTIPKGL